MKTTLILFTLTTAAALAESAIPQPFPIERYDEMLEVSPFVLATKPEEKAEEAKNSVFQDVYITSMTVGDDGRTVVYVKKPGDERGIKIVGDETEKDSGISITSIDWSDGWKNAKVGAKHTNGETRMLKFNENAVPTAPVGAPPGMGPRGLGGNRMVPPVGGPAGQPVVTTTPGAPAAMVPKTAPAATVPRPTFQPVKVSGTGVTRPGVGATLNGTNGTPQTFSPNSGIERRRERGPINNGAGTNGTNNGGRGTGRQR